ncbi:MULTISPECIES: TIGR01777 family oxidoreductase [unclassified Diaminobutyricimonas]|uniref:TIGR01777 family oxidoreductase n=1 Tax=unclassified Diaminobutyricimonas TaxID=2643261 RepID=UPI0012F48DEB|nr:MULTISPECIES: TIGR01777 family oxidoreductase [unclassified Diaminobutyricimonas]
MRILISGASGFIGAELQRQLARENHDVLKLVRRQPRDATEINWAPAAKVIDFRVLDNVDAVVNLSGASTGRIPWTRGYKKQLRESRVQSTRALAEAMNMASTPPRVFISASAVGYYGNRPGERLTENSSKGVGFFADLVNDWEQAAALAPEKTRVVNTRSGIVIGRGGGALAPLMLTTRFGLGARFGTGGQHWPWISLYDEAAAIRHLLTSEIRGPVNLVGPTPATSHRITTELARAMHRWHKLALPEGLVSALMGEAARELLLVSQKAVPVRLQEDGFEFRHPRVEDAIAAAFR